MQDFDYDLVVHIVLMMRFILITQLAVLYIYFFVELKKKIHEG